MGGIGEAILAGIGFGGGGGAGAGIGAGAAGTGGAGLTTLAELGGAGLTLAEAAGGAGGGGLAEAGVAGLTEAAGTTLAEVAATQPELASTLGITGGEVAGTIEAGGQIAAGGEVLGGPATLGELGIGGGGAAAPGALPAGFEVAPDLAEQLSQLEDPTFFQQFGDVAKDFAKGSTPGLVASLFEQPQRGQLHHAARSQAPVPIDNPGLAQLIQLSQSYVTAPIPFPSGF